MRRPCRGTPVSWEDQTKLLVTDRDGAGQWRLVLGLEEPPSSPGTTWVQQVLSLILYKDHLWPVHHVPNWERAPWLEHTNLSKLLPSLDPCKPRLLTSHLGAKDLWPALLPSKARVREVREAQRAQERGMGGWNATGTSRDGRSL